jgi:F-type H+-transporting ATPase subunit a
VCFAIAGSGGFVMLDPLHQFEVHPLLKFSFNGIDLSFTNASAWMAFVTLFICLFLHLGSSKGRLIPGKIQSLCEVLFKFVSGIVTEQVGPEGRVAIPYIFALFVFILFANLVGLLPYAFTITSHLAVTFTLAMLVFLGITVVGAARHGMKFFKMFLPSGVPTFIAPLLVPVEIVSYIARPISLSIRLFANMVAGHIVLKIIASAAVVCAVNSLAPLAVFPVGINVLLTTFELFVAVLQAYVFTILSCIYLNSVLHAH